MSADDKLSREQRAGVREEALAAIEEMNQMMRLYTIQGAQPPVGTLRVLLSMGALLDENAALARRVEELEGRKRVWAEEVVRLCRRHTPGVQHSDLNYDPSEWCVPGEHGHGPATLIVECVEGLLALATDGEASDE